MNILDFKEGQTYICTKSDKQWWTVGKEYPVFLDSDNEPAIRDDDGDDWHSSFLSITINQFKLKEEQPKVTLDEPQKPVVPKFVAEWIEYAKKKGDSLAISFKPWNLYGVEYSKADRWIEDNQETFARAWIDGYEVEKEPLYSVIIAGEYLVKEISCSNEVKLVSTAYLPQYLAHHYQLTEKQIKAIDERFWPFAVPVEEVVER
ncbi:MULTISPECIES: DUF1642 domain-containing protein [Enterococcus]|uniref:DUF1642 domain-containing protein n=1 Tax=Enterococcus TaxID=1350 RepID=UPI00221F9C54|nr:MULTISPECIES: DUF1642 domain-containing protein [Enterococcus]UYT91080.1 DUF1642 domain-containing protein [Enterococcus faecium]UYT95744.1 DUF1642 domain-containing protein [Enterococcus hirae]UYT97508.1 DUF1642 domain-containing protein [Enterococcus hirae]UYU00795.1 DUF1642 domain-containing protein [Enterococcus hirae]